MIKKVLIEEPHHQLSEREKQQLDDPNDQMEKIAYTAPSKQTICLYVYYVCTCKQFAKSEKRK